MFCTMQQAMITAFATPLSMVNKSSLIQHETATYRRKPMMSTTGLSRREVGKLILGAAVTPLLSSNVAHAAKGQKAPIFVKDESGIQYYDVKTGSGAFPIEGDFVIIDYLAFLSNGTIFDSRKGFVFQMGQRQVIPGLEAAVASMKQGGERRVVVPASLAYGNKGVCLPDKDECLVPPGERLGYDVTLQRVAVPPT